MSYDLFYCASRKQKFIEKLQEDGSEVVIVGDNRNDLKAMKKCIGVLVKANHNASMEESAGAVIEEGASLLSIPAAVRISNRTNCIIKQNIVISLGYNISVTLVTTGLFVFKHFALEPYIAISLILLETALIGFNSYRFCGKNFISKGVTSSSSSTYGSLSRIHDKRNSNDSLLGQNNGYE